MLRGRWSARPLRATLAVVLGTLAACSPPSPEGAAPVDPPDEPWDPIVPPPWTPPPSCEVVLAGPAWIVEGELLRLSVRCGGGEALPEGVALEGLPAAATLDGPAGEIAWQTGLADAGVYEAVVRGAGATAGRLRVGVVDRWDASGNTPPEPARYTEEYGLPVFHLEVDAAISDLAYVPATLTYRGRTYALEVKHRGSRSLAFPKKSFTLAFPDGGRFSDPALGFPSRKKVLLVTTFDDQTQVRDRLALGLWGRLADRPIDVRTASAVLYLNGEYRGVYVMSEKIGGQVLSEHGLDGDGNLYQAKTNLANFYEAGNEGQPKLTWHDGYEKEEGTPLEGEPGAFDDLDELVRLVVTADDATFAAELPALADVDELRDWWVLVMLSLSSDCARKNVFLFRDPLLGGPWRATVWDYSSSLGQDWHTHRQSPRTSVEFTWENGLFRRLLAPPFASGTRARLGAAVRERAPLAGVLAELDRLVAETEPAARRDEARWGETQRQFFEREGRTGWASYEDEVAYTRRWIEERWAYLGEMY